LLLYTANTLLLI